MAEQGKVYALVGDFYHSPEYLLQGLLDFQDTVDYRISAFENPLQFPWDSLQSRDVLILSLMGRIQPEQSSRVWMEDLHDKKLSAFLESGGGLLALHSVLAQYPDNSLMYDILRGRFTHHPEGLQEVRITPENSGHPVCRGVEAFSISDEQYFVDLDEADTTVLLRGESEAHGTAPAGWAHSRGNGRVVVLTPGHTLKVLRHPMMQRLIGNSISWCRGE